MILRANKILLALLLFQCALVANAFWTYLSPGGGPPAKIFESLDPVSVTALSFLSQEGQSAELKRDTEGKWSIAEKEGYPADEAKVEEFLAKLQKLDNRVVVASTRSAHSRLKVAENKYDRKVVIHRSGSAQEETLFIGTAPSQGQLHIRIGGDDRVYLSRDLSAWEAGTDSASWLKRDYLKIPTGRLTEIEVQNPKGLFRFFKGDNGQWVMDGLASGETVNANAVDILVNKIATLRMQDVLGKTEKASYGLDAPVLRAALSYRPAEDSGSPHSVILVVGPKDEGKDNHIVKSSESPFYVTVPAYALREVIEARRADYVSSKTGSASPNR